MQGIRIINLSRKGGTERFKIHGNDVVKDAQGNPWCQKDAEKNKIEKITLNGVEVTPDSTRTVAIVTTGGGGDRYSLIKEEDAEEGYFATYKLTKNGAQEGVSINIPKNYVLREINKYIYGQEPSGVTPPQGYDLEEGDVYFDFVVNTIDDTENASHLYLPARDLSIAYNAGVGITIDQNNEISVNLGKGLGFDENDNTIYVKIDESEDIVYLELGENGLKMSSAFETLLDNLVYFTDRDFNN